MDYCLFSLCHKWRKFGFFSNTSIEIVTGIFIVFISFPSTDRNKQSAIDTTVTDEYYQELSHEGIVMNDAVPTRTFVYDETRGTEQSVLPSGNEEPRGSLFKSIGSGKQQKP